MNKILNYLFKNPDVILLNSDGVYLKRWHLYRARRESTFSILRSNIYLHQFLQGDADRALHDHPWNSLGMILSGSYDEHVPKNFEDWVKYNNRETKIIKRHAFRPVYRPACYTHMIKLHEDKEYKLKPVWTLFITSEKIREWGFWCKDGWIHNKEFLSEDGTIKESGCPEDEIKVKED